MKSINILPTIFLLFVILASIILPIAQSVSTTDNQKVYLSTWILVPAVVVGIPHEEGKLLNVSIVLSIPGNGTIIVRDEGGEVSGSTKFSMATAIATASLLNDVDWTSLDAYIYIRSRGVISGPSGSLAVAIATYALLNPLLNVSLLHHYVITGAIAPEGLAGSVGGVKVKCEAATRENLTFILPLSNIYDLKGSNCENYIPTTDVINAISVIYGMKPLVSNVTLTTSYPKPLAEVMRSFTYNIIELAQRNLNETISNLTEVPVREVNTIKSYISYASKYINEAKKYVDKYPYSAASYAYTAYIYSLLSKYITLSYIKNGNLFISNEIARINATLKNLSVELSKIKPTTLERAELLSVAAARLADAYLSLSTVEFLLHSKANSSLLFYQLALASGRTESIKSWLRSAEREKGTIPVSQKFLKALALKAYRFALLNLGYSISLLKSSGLNAEASALKDLEERMTSAFERKDWILVIGYAREAISQATDYTFEYSISVLPLTEKEKIDPIYADDIEVIAKLLEMQLALHGIKSPLAPAYIEYYKVLKKNGDYDAALKLLWSAVADLEILSLAFLKGPSISSKASFQPPQINVGGVSSLSLINRFYIYIITLGFLVLGIAIGYVLAVRSTLKEIERRLS